VHAWETGVHCPHRHTVGHFEGGFIWLRLQTNPMATDCIVDILIQNAGEAVETAVSGSALRRRCGDDGPANKTELSRRKQQEAAGHLVLMTLFH